jgi:hypothetical protein
MSSGNWPVEHPICLDIMRELLGFPSSSVFQSPLLCRTPVGLVCLSLPIIYDRLRAGIYTSADDWIGDVTSCLWTRMATPTSNGHNARLVGYLAEDYMRRLRKRLMRLKLTTFEGWLKQAERLNLKFSQLFQSAPNQTSFPVVPIPRAVTQRLNPAQYEFIVKMCPRVTNPIDLIQLTRIIESDPAQGVLVQNGEMKVELAQLAMPTACRIFDFLRMIFPSEHVELPSLCTGFTARFPEL